MNAAAGAYDRLIGTPLVIVLIADQPPAAEDPFHHRVAGSCAKRRSLPNGSSHTTLVVLLSGWS